MLHPVMPEGEAKGNLHICGEFVEKRGGTSDNLRGLLFRDL